MASLEKRSSTVSLYTESPRLEQRHHDLVQKAFQQHRYLWVAHGLGYLAVAEQQRGYVRVTRPAFSTRTFTCSHNFVAATARPLLEVPDGRRRSGFFDDLC